MNKLTMDFLVQCLGKDVCTSELVVLPPNGDVGFDEYFDYKTKEVIKAKRIFSPMEQNKLLLSYPGPKSFEAFIFDRFFESPNIVSKNRGFEGCFGIDITDYIGKTDDEHFHKLMTYVALNPKAVYVFILFSNNKNEVSSIYEVINQSVECRLVDISLPDKTTLVDYTISKIREFTDHVKRPVYDFFQEYYENRECGFDDADYIVRSLKTQNITGDLEEIKTVVEKINSEKKIGGSSIDFGY